MVNAFMGASDELNILFRRRIHSIKCEINKSQKLKLRNKKEIH